MSTIVKPFTFSSGAVIIASEHNDNYDTIYSDFNGNITNANIDPNANIGNSKLNLASITQNISLSGNLTLTGSANDFSGATISDLGTVTTADINGGTIDGTNIGATTQGTAHVSTLKVGTTNQGDVLYDNGTSIVRLTPGTSGQFLKTQGAAANPAWDDVVTPTQASASRQSGTGGTSSSFSTIDTVDKTITSGKTVFAICSFRFDGGANSATETINFKHGSTTIQQLTIPIDSGTIKTVTMQGIVTGLSGSTTFTLESHHNQSGSGSDYTEVNITIIEF